MKIVHFPFVQKPISFITFSIQFLLQISMNRIELDEIEVHVFRI